MKIEKETITLIKKHLKHAREKYPNFHLTDSLRMSILGEEFGEVCMAWNDRDPDSYRQELGDLIAVAIRCLEGN